MRRLNVADVEAIVADLRASLEEFGAPGEDLDTLPGSQPDDPEIQAAMARRRVRQIVRAAAAHVPYYRRWFAANGISPSDISVETLSQIPRRPRTRSAPPRPRSSATRPSRS